MKIIIATIIVLAGIAFIVIGPTPREHLYRVGNEPVVVNMDNWTFPFPTLPSWPISTPKPDMPHAHRVQHLTEAQEREAYLMLIKGRPLGTFTQTKTKPPGALPFAQ